jgi:2-polyprenyl-3-methyl-5-hydroxy-6-metoxy-1,4-benzoquinol methylase
VVPFGLQTTVPRKADQDLLGDPVAAYDQVAPEFARLSEQRKSYLHSVEQVIISETPSGMRSLLDVGAGDGTRAWRIAQAGKLETVVLLEPSAKMRSRCPAQAQVWAMRAEDLRHKQAQFDVITCLWNVLGHIFPAASRIEVLRQFAHLLSPGGKIFIDVSHRYNARHYGILPTALRFVKDYISPGEQNGDVVAAWSLGETQCATRGHVFTHKEFRSLSRAAGLTMEKRFVIDYATGKQHQCSFNGNLLYLLRRT